MKSKLLSLFVVLTLFTGVTPTSSSETRTFPCGGSATYSVSMPAGVATDGKQCSGTLVIDGSVKIIGVEAFWYSQLISVTIPNTVTTIGAIAFAGTKLQSVTIPNSVTSIGDGAFADTPLTSVTIPNSVSTIGYSAFSVTKLISVTLPNSLTSVSGGMFRKSQLTSVTIPTSVSTIGDFAFAETNLTSVNIPNSVTRLGEGAFYDTPLASVTIPNSVTSISNRAFLGTKLISVNIPNSVSEIGFQAFAEIPTLITISLPDNLKTLGQNVFVGNNSLSRIEYCGRLTGFPVTPVCPRDVLNAEAKAKAEAEAKAQEELQIKAIESKCQEISKSFAMLKETIFKTISTYPKYVKEFSTILQESVFFISCPSQVDLERIQANFDKVVIKAQVSVGKTTITCLKGKKIKKVTAVKPKCPKGYKKK